MRGFNPRLTAARHVNERRALGPFAFVDGLVVVNFQADHADLVRVFRAGSRNHHRSGPSKNVYRRDGG
jgi:hypothetical protein